MIKVLVVEDELPTARVVSRLVDQHPAFTVVGMEGDGECALQFLRDNPVDVVITDIEMPVMNGLKLLEEIQRDFPQCITLILTGFSYFSYAKTALQLRAYDYILKPLEPEAFFRILTRLEGHWKEQAYARKHTLLGQALSGEQGDTDGTLYHLLVTVTRGTPEDNPDPSRWQKQLGNRCHVFNSDLNKERIVIVEAAEWSADRIKQCDQTGSVCVDTAYSVDPVPLSELRQTAKHLRTVLEQQARLFCGTLIAVDLSHPPAFRRAKPLQEMYPERAVEAICAQNRAELNACLSQMWETAERCGSLRSDAYAYFSAVLLDRRIAQQVTPEKLCQTKHHLWEIVDASPNAKVCTDQVIECLLTLLQETSSKRSVAERVDEIAFYIDTNYHMPISVESLCKQFGFVPRHLNKIFKKYKGVRPTEYLLNLRIQKAKHILQSKPDALVKDVAASVGYHDPHYFSTVFYRATGLWPTEVQQNSL